MRLEISLLAGLVFAGLAGPAAADENWGSAKTVEVQLVNYAFAPSTIRLHASEPVRIKIVNRSRTAHAFHSPSFFGAGLVREEDRQLVRGGRVFVPAGESRQVTVLPAAGRFVLRCSHQVHKMVGMRGQIIVE